MAAAHYDPTDKSWTPDTGDTGPFQPGPEQKSGSSPRTKGQATHTLMSYEEDLYNVILPTKWHASDVIKREHMFTPASSSPEDRRLSGGRDHNFSRCPPRHLQSHTRGGGPDLECWTQLGWAMVRSHFQSFGICIVTKNAYQNIAKKQWNLWTWHALSEKAYDKIM